MSQFIDRRLNAGNKSMVNRQRFLRRYKNQIKQAVSDAVGKRSITDIDQGEPISIPKQDISEPQFQCGRQGYIEQVFPGNEEFMGGDLIKRPQQSRSGGAPGDQGNSEGTSEDEFTFQLSREEFMDLYFEDLALPDLIKKDLKSIRDYQIVRTGITQTGTPANINVVRSMRQATARRIALTTPYKRRLKDVMAILDQCQESPCKTHEERMDLEAERDRLKKKIKSIPFIDTIDLRYNNHMRLPLPSTQAVMFCVMDVSGSMDEVKKDIAKRFFILLYLFLTKNYEKIELVFIRHHTSAKEVDEQAFFYSRETGGTVVSSALDLLSQLIETRYPSSGWNIYVAQASDGDNWNADSPYCKELLHEKIMPWIQYFAYIEIMPRHHQSLWDAYQQIQRKYANFAMENIDNLGDIYPVFHNLFKRKMA